MIEVALMRHYHVKSDLTIEYRRNRLVVMYSLDNLCEDRSYTQHRELRQVLGLLQRNGIGGDNLLNSTLPLLIVRTTPCATPLLLSANYYPQKKYVSTIQLSKNLHTFVLTILLNNIVILQNYGQTRTSKQRE